MDIQPGIVDELAFWRWISIFRKTAEVACLRKKRREWLWSPPIVEEAKVAGHARATRTNRRTETHEVAGFRSSRKTEDKRKSLKKQGVCGVFK